MNNIEEKRNIKLNKIKILRYVIFIIVFAIIIWATVKFLPLIGKLANESDRIAFKENINNMGFLGVLVTLGLQILQIIVAVIPGQPVEIIAGMLYGTIGGVALCTVGIFIGTFFVFYFVRKFGADVIQLFFSEDKINEIKESKLFKNQKKFEILLFIVFLIPFIPKDIFIYLGGISPVRAKRFLFLATIARIPGLFLSVHAGNKLSQGNFLVTILLFIFIIVIGIVGYYVSEKARKNLEN